MTPKELEQYALGRLLRHLSRKKWHIALSLTRNCPLACRHCIVSAQRGTFDRSPEVQKLSDWVLAGLESAHDRVLALSFTGGESPLADLAFKRIGEYASHKNIACGLVTSGYFAKNVETARSFFEEHPFLTSLTVSFDEYHEEFLPVHYGLNALQAARELGLSVSARHSGRFRGSYYQKLQSVLVPRFGEILENQELVFGGRASQLSAPATEVTALSQCPSDGPHISANGQILPCCSTIIYQESNPCLSLGNIIDTTFVEMLDRMDGMPIISILRAWGWDHIIDNVPELLSIEPELKSMGGCSQCERITCSPNSARLVNDWLTRSEGAKFSSASAVELITRVQKAPLPPQDWQRSETRESNH